jgi:hypothetical protein
MDESVDNLLSKVTPDRRRFVQTILGLGGYTVPTVRTFLMAAAVAGPTLASTVTTTAAPSTTAPPTTTPTPTTTAPPTTTPAPTTTAPPTTTPAPTTTHSATTTRNPWRASAPSQPVSPSHSLIPPVTRAGFKKP